MAKRVFKVPHFPRRDLVRLTAGAADMAGYHERLPEGYQRPRDMVWAEAALSDRLLLRMALEQYARCPWAYTFEVHLHGVRTEAARTAAKMVWC